MKIICLQVLTVLVFNVAIIPSGFGELRNAYERDIETAHISRHALETLLTNKNLSSRQYRILQQRLNQQIEFIYAHEITAKLIGQLHTISPSIYDELDTLTDRHGRKVDVFVKCVRAYSSLTSAAGVTFIAQAENDQHQYISAMGENTVLVNVWIVDNAVAVLAHELGHVKYQVQNLASYMLFYKNTYRGGAGQEGIGHHVHDKSGQASIVMEHRFRKDYINFLKAYGKEENLSALYYARRKRKNNYQ